LLLSLAASAIETHAFLLALAAPINRNELLHLNRNELLHLPILRRVLISSQSNKILKVQLLIAIS